MVSCTRIEGTLQAYIDGELGDSDRAIFEQHVDECELCRESLRSQQRANAALFAAFSNERLNYPLRGRVLAHLPEMELVRRNSDSVVDLINERAKNPLTMWGRVGRLMPAAAVAILLFITLILNYSVTETNELGPVTSIGMVTHAVGLAMHAPGNGPEVNPADLQSYVMRGDAFETRHGSSIMLALTGPTSVKIGSSTRVLVSDARNITLDYGRIWLDVGRDGKLFHVHTPRGEVTVFGTCFTVSYIDERTTVTVERGEVQVEKDEDFRKVEAGEQAEVLTDGSLSEPVAVDVKYADAWARRIMPDPAAESAFNNRVQINSPVGELPARLVYKIDTYGGEVSSIRLYWEPEPNLPKPDYCAYDLYVLSANGKPLMHRKLEGSKFAQPGISSLDVPLDTPISGINSAEIRLVPDYKTGRIELKDVELKYVVTKEEGS